MIRVHWAIRNRIVAGQVKAEAKSSEIMAIPRLPDLLVLKGCIVTIDAMGCRKEIASRIIEKEVDSSVSLKGQSGKCI